MCGFTTLERTMDKSTTYEVRRLGMAAWKLDIPREEQAHIEALRAKQVTGLDHQVFMIDGDTVNGPILEPEGFPF